MISDEPPADDEVEITLLGRGVGESCLVHFGNGRWIVVDSLKERRGNAAALSYLETIGVSPSRVEHLIVTHFHRDHYQGIDLLHDACRNARLWVTAALQTRRFLEIFGTIPSEFSDLSETMVRARRRQLSPTTPGLTRLSVGRNVIDEGGVRIRAIAPSEMAVDASCEELADALQLGPTALRGRLSRDNRCSVALHIDVLGIGALLGGDVENAPAEFGWKAVLEEPLHRLLEPVELIKVPHHGSKGAHDDEMWSRLVSPDATLFVAPFTALRHPIPSPGDQLRLLSFGRLWQAAASSDRRVLRGESGVRVVQRARKPVGVVRARRRPDTPWSVTVSPPAFEVIASNIQRSS